MKNPTRSLIAGCWIWLRIDNFFEVLGGIQKTPKRKPVSHCFPYLRVANVYRSKLDLTEIAYFELFEGELERWQLKAGDLLVVEGNGSETEIGRCAIWNEEIRDCVHQNHIIRCRPIGHNGELFTLLFLNSPAGMAEMKKLAITSHPEPRSQSSLPKGPYKTLSVQNLTQIQHCRVSWQDVEQFTLRNVLQR